MMTATGLDVRPEEGTLRLYHVSPEVLAPAILRQGVDPAFANGVLKVSWWCEKQALMWAIAHISYLKQIAVPQLVVHQSTFWAGAVLKTRWQHVYQCRTLATTNRTYHAGECLDWFNPNGEWKNG